MHIDRRVELFLLFAFVTVLTVAASSLYGVYLLVALWWENLGPRDFLITGLTIIIVQNTTRWYLERRAQIQLRLEQEKRFNFIPKRTRKHKKQNKGCPQKELESFKKAHKGMLSRALAACERLDAMRKRNLLRHKNFNQIMERHAPRPLTAAQLKVEAQAQRKLEQQVVESRKEICDLMKWSRARDNQRKVVAEIERQQNRHLEDWQPSIVASTPPLPFNARDTGKRPERVSFFDALDMFKAANEIFSIDQSPGRLLGVENTFCRALWALKDLLEGHYVPSYKRKYRIAQLLSWFPTAGAHDFTLSPPDSNKNNAAPNIRGLFTYTPAIQECFRRLGFDVAQETGNNFNASGLQGDWAMRRVKGPSHDSPQETAMGVYLEHGDLEKLETLQVKEFMRNFERECRKGSFLSDFQRSCQVTMPVIHAAMERDKQLWRYSIIARPVSHVTAIAQFESEFDVKMRAVRREAIHYEEEHTGTRFAQVTSERVEREEDRRLEERRNMWKALLRLNRESDPLHWPLEVQLKDKWSTASKPGFVAVCGVSLFLVGGMIYHKYFE
ncbi:uncharacterized protein LOC116611694 [Nematostella vectensis]|uniref:uncharacterized protein LOC116611694 n=1 Tax=Nematostella vectensis TaxID=45351 RepID=UPI0020770485|nr:uncharacterized protein LOC116611694 [Nematostella vectensis]